MKKLIKPIIYSLIALIAVIGLTAGRANAQSVLSSSSISSIIQDSKNILIASAPSDCVIDELRPNPDNPNTFYSCAPYGPVLMQCPSELVFDVKANRCEWPTEEQEPITESDTQTSKTTIK